MPAQERGRLEQGNAALRRFKGPETCPAGAVPALALPGRPIVNVGNVGSEDAWEVTRR